MISIPLTPLYVCSPRPLDQIVHKRKRKNFHLNINQITSFHAINPSVVLNCAWSKIRSPCNLLQRPSCTNHGNFLYSSFCFITTFQPPNTLLSLPEQLPLRDFALVVPLAWNSSQQYPYIHSLQELSEGLSHCLSEQPFTIADNLNLLCFSSLLLSQLEFYNFHLLIKCPLPACAVPARMWIP